MDPLWFSRFHTFLHYFFQDNTLLIILLLFLANAQNPAESWHQLE